MKRSPLEHLRSLPAWQYLVFVELVYVLLSLSLFLSWPLLWPDEVHFADAARTFSTKGYFGTDLIKGMESHVYWQPPFYFIVSAAVILIGGFNIIALRLFSILIGAGILVLVHHLGVRVAENPLVPKVGTLLLALNPNFVNYVKLARMDGLCVLFTLFALLTYVRTFKLSSCRKGLLVGLFLTLAVLTHPMGLIGVVSVIAHRLLARAGSRHKKVRDVFVMLIPLVIGLGLWGLYILEDPQSFLLQMEFQFRRKSRSLLGSWANFVEGYRSIPLFLPVLVVSALYLLRKVIREKLTSLTLLATLFFLSLFVIASTLEFQYHLYFLPYASLGIGVLLSQGLKSSSIFLRRCSLIGGVLLMLNFLIYFAYFNFTLHFRLSKETDYKDFVAQVEGFLSPPHSNVYLYGYPSLFWGLRESGKNLSFVEAVFLDNQKAAQVVREIDYVVLARGFDPLIDGPELEQHRLFLENLCFENGLVLHAVGGVGVKKRFAYSAEIYKVTATSASPSWKSRS